MSAMTRDPFTCRRLFDSSSHFRIVDAVRLVVVDVWRLLALLLLLLLGSGLAFYSLFKQACAVSCT
jgi:hypothetical protein